MFFFSGLCYGADSPDSNYEAGLRYARAGRFNEARKEFKDVLRLYRNYRPAKVNLVVITDVLSHKIKMETALHFFNAVDYTAKERFGEALNEFDKMIASDPNYAFGYYNRGSFHQYRNEYDKAFSDYTRAIRLDPDMVDAYVNRGFVNSIRSGSIRAGCADWKSACKLGLCDYYRTGKKQGYCK